MEGCEVVRSAIRTRRMGEKTRERVEALWKEREVREGASIYREWEPKTASEK